jgi:hypothetical protein
VIASEEKDTATEDRVRGAVSSAQEVEDTVAKDTAVMLDSAGRVREDKEEVTCRSLLPLLREVAGSIAAAAAPAAVVPWRLCYS